MTRRRGKSARRKNGIREPNGRISRTKGNVEAMTQADMDQVRSVAVEARLRQGIDKRHVENPLAGTAYGRLRLMGFAGGGINEKQYQAAERVHKDIVQYMRAIQSPKPAGAVDLNRANGLSTVDADYEAERHAAAKRRGERIISILDEAQRSTGGRPRLAVLTIVVEDRDATHLVGDLRVALNALVRFYGLNKVGGGEIMVAG